jgi:hypothetical protein
MTGWLTRSRHDVQSRQPDCLSIVAIVGASHHVLLMKIIYWRFIVELAFTKHCCRVGSRVKKESLTSTCNSLFYGEDWSVWKKSTEPWHCGEIFIESILSGIEEMKLA